MLLLILFVVTAVGFSFLCSIAEAVLLTTPMAYIKQLEKDGLKSGRALIQLKQDINSPLAVILTLNTIAHTVGAAGAGAQASVVWGSGALGVFSALLTLAILVFSEIIPKALGANHWRVLAPSVGLCLIYLVRVLKPFVRVSNALTSLFAKDSDIGSFSRKEFQAMAELGEEEGQLAPQEAQIIKSIFNLQDLKVHQVMTPKTVVFQLPVALTVGQYFSRYASKEFSRIPLFNYEETVTGFVLKSDILMAQCQNLPEKTLADLQRPLAAIPDVCTLLSAFDQFLEGQHQILLVVNEYGETRGIITLEDILEATFGLNIVDESDRVDNMRTVAKRLAQLRGRLLNDKKLD